MNFLVALLIGSLSCAEPALSFRDFYTKYYAPGTKEHWQGYNGESMQSIFVRQSEASADFLEYRVARMEKCR